MLCSVSHAHAIPDLVPVNNVYADSLKIMLVQGERPLSYRLGFDTVSFQIVMFD